ncbi:tRNA pseudouridine synthase A, partial [Pseudolycoriella hygida]
MMYRYLLNISYIGTNFRGLQKNSNHPIPGLKSSIQESIEWAIKEFAPKNEPKLILSSRTDVGVHALNTAVHIDLESNFGGPYRESFVTTRLNKFFYRENLAIRIQKTEIVPETFHARFSVKRRIYEYRLAIPKKELPAGSKERFVPIDELYRCHFEKIPKFDVHLAKKAAELIQGTHDFRSFMGTNPETIKKDAFFALRHIDSISIEPGETTCHELIKPLAVETYNYFNV